MDYVTRQLLLLLTKSVEAIKQYSDSINTIYKNSGKNRQIHNEWLKKIATAHEKSEGDKRKSEHRTNSIQNSIRYATWTAAIGAIIYAGIALRQWNDAQSNFKMDQRAWLHVLRKNDPMFSTDAPVFIQLQPAASGKTIAKNVEGTISLTSIGKGESLDLSLNEFSRKFKIPILVPELPLPPQPVFLNYRGIELARINEPTYNEFKTGNRIAILYGRVTYQDVFDIHHFTQFCETFHGTPPDLPLPDFNPAQMACTQYNAIDPVNE
jgi:hypothetical protein